MGGISYGYEFPGKILHDNAKMVLNIFENARVHNVQQIINPISNCAYPGDLNIYEEKTFGMENLTTLFLIMLLQED